MSNKAIDVAKFFTLLANANNEARLTHLQLQKLVYIAHGITLAMLDRPLISDPVIAWQYGPIIPALYWELKEHRGNPVPPLHHTPAIEHVEAEVLRAVYSAYGSLTGVQLSSIANITASPWELIWNRHLNGGPTLIPDDLIGNYYKRITECQNTQTPPPEEQKNPLSPKKKEKVFLFL
ncbi:Panacea domain-containing protein [Aeromonas veronii]|nr:type II toxin-antitoxin system antitoxin SocA domain-containing protein [Aeromonas veronii]